MTPTAATIVANDNPIIPAKKGEYIIEPSIPWFVSLRKYRDLQHFKQCELAKALGPNWTNSKIRKLESGQITLTEEEVYKWGQALNVDKDVIKYGIETGYIPIKKPEESKIIQFIMPEKECREILKANVCKIFDSSRITDNEAIELMCGLKIAFDNLMMAPLTHAK